MALSKEWKREALVGSMWGLAAGAVAYALWPKPKPWDAPSTRPVGVKPIAHVPSTPQCVTDGSGASMSTSPPGAVASCPIPSFPESIPERDAYILSRIKVGDFDINWVPISSVINGHVATFWVSADALKVDGVRVTMTARGEQQAADLMGASLLTPKLADLMFLQADIVLPPMTRPLDVQNGTMSTAKVMVAQSRDIDKAIIAKAGSLADAKDKLVSTVGKDWVITQALARKPEAGANYGWHFHGPKFANLSGEVMASLAKDPATGAYLRGLQGIGTRHDSIGHTDYSQNVRLVLNKVNVDGQIVPLATVLTTPELAPLASHEGAMTVLRQPGTPVLVA